MSIWPRAGQVSLIDTTHMGVDSSWTASWHALHDISTHGGVSRIGVVSRHICERRFVGFHIFHGHKAQWGTRQIQLNVDHGIDHKLYAWEGCLTQAQHSLGCLNVDASSLQINQACTSRALHGPIV